MSYVRQADSSAAYADSDLYIRKFGVPRPDFSMRRFAAEKQMCRYGPEAYGAGVYGPTCFADSPSPAFEDSLYNLQVSSLPYHVMHNGKSSIIPEKQSPVTSNISQQTSQSTSENMSSEQEVEFDEDEVRLKLQELEHALLDDEDEVLLELYQVGSIAEEWADPMKLLPNSPKESSSDSTISCIGSNNGEVRTPKQLLFDCAAAIAEGSIEEAQTMISELRQMVAIQGEPPQRIAAYLVEGLAARIATSGQGIYKALRCKEPPTLYQLSAMQILFEVCPCFRLGFMAANYAIIEACKGEDTVHIIDFDINQGTQYITLIQTLSNHANKPRRLRITGVDDPESVQRVVGGLNVIGQRLEKLAEDCKVQFEFQAIGTNIGDVTPAMLDCRPGEALVVNLAFQLHHLPDESVSTMNERDRLLRMVKGLRPKLVTLVEQDTNTNTAPFLQRFIEVYNYYSALFDSLDATLPRESADRMNVERQCLAREIVNIIACEGADRVERYEVAGKWRARMTMAGFVSCPFNGNVTTAIRSLLKSYCNMYKFEEESGGLHFGWGDKSLVVSSAWR